MAVQLEVDTSVRSAFADREAVEKVAAPVRRGPEELIRKAAAYPTLDLRIIDHARQVYP